MLGNAIGNGVSFFREGYSRESWAIFNAMTTKPDGDRKRLINNLTKGLIVDFLWPGKDCYYVMAAHTNDNGEAQINWKNPGTFDLILVNNPAFEVDRGFTGNGTTQYIRTQYNPNSDAVNYAQNDASFGVYVRTNINENTTDIGKTAVVRANLATRWGSDVYYARLNNSGTQSGESSDSRGFILLSRIVAANYNYYRNKAQTNYAIASTGIPNLEFYILALNSAGVAAEFSTKQIAASFIGSGMTQTNVNNETDRLETFLDAIGAGVIS